jgi:hypothetical protein
MADTFHGLQKQSIESIYEKTRIPHENIKKLLAKDFTAFSKVQFLGFISILEREYDLNLQELKDEYFLATGTAPNETHLPEALITPKKKKPLNKRVLLLVLFISVAAAIIYVIVKTMALEPEDAVKTPPKVLQNVKNRIQEINETKQLAVAEALVVEEENSTADEASIEKAEAPKRLIILPKRRVWMGLIEQPDGKRIQKIIDGPYEINTSKEWLMVFGHGYIDIEFDNKLSEYSDQNKVWFMYEGGNFEALDRETFKMRNQGKNW